MEPASVAERKFIIIFSVLCSRVEISCSVNVIEKKLLPSGRTGGRFSVFFPGRISHRDRAAEEKDRVIGKQLGENLEQLHVVK